MIKSFSIGNFKAFGETQTIPIRPITLVFGPNSSGKSSVLQAMALAHEANRTGNLDVVRTQLGGTSIDLGGFGQYVHKRKVANRVSMGMSVSAAVPSTGHNATIRVGDVLDVEFIFDMPLNDVGEPLPGTKPRVSYYEVRLEGDLLMKMGLRSGGDESYYVLEDFNIEHPIIRRTLSNTPSVFQVDQETMHRQHEFMASVHVLPGRLFPGSFQLNLPSQALDPRAVAARSAAKALNVGFVTRLFRLINPMFGPRVEGDIQDDRRRDFAMLMDELHTEIVRSAQTELDRLFYLGPVRVIPPRHLAFAEGEDQNWFAGGGHAWDVVRNDEMVRAQVNKWLSHEKLKTQYELQVHPYSSHVWDEVDTSIYEALNSIYDDLADEGIELTPEEAAELEAAFDVIEEADDTPLNRWDPTEFRDRIMKGLSDAAERRGVKELVLVDKRMNNTIVSHRDVGLGVSQVLPVLVSAFGSQGKTIAIEQPEIHLHPMLQAELADVFIEGALGDRRNTFILETHSEHLMLRILRRIRETQKGTLGDGMVKIRPSDVSFLYVEPAEAGSFVTFMTINDEGDISEGWPEGFFDERFEELV